MVCPSENGRDIQVMFIIFRTMLLQKYCVNYNSLHFKHLYTFKNDYEQILVC